MILALYLDNNHGGEGRREKSELAFSFQIFQLRQDLVYYKGQEHKYNYLLFPSPMLYPNKKKQISPFLSTFPIQTWQAYC